MNWHGNFLILFCFYDFLIDYFGKLNFKLGKKNASFSRFHLIFLFQDFLRFHNKLSSMTFEIVPMNAASLPGSVIPKRRILLMVSKMR